MLSRDAGDRPPSLGIIPFGRGNDLAFGLGVPFELDAAAGAIAEDRPGPFDIGIVRGGDYPEGRYFGNGVGIGFDARVGFVAAKFRHIHSSLTYTLGALSIFALFPEPPDVRISSASLAYDGQCQQISIMNGSRMGGSYYMAPEARIDDGTLDLCIVGKTSRLELAGLILRYTKGSQAGQPKVRMAKANSVVVEAVRGSLAVHADGETICESGSRIEVTCLAGALQAYGINSLDRAGPHGAAAMHGADRGRGEAASGGGGAKVAD